MKKFFSILTILILLTSVVFAGDFNFVLTELDQHPELLAGFLPTLTSIGTRYEGLTLIKGNTTAIQGTIGGGYTQRILYQNPIDGTVLDGDFGVFDSVQLRWNLKLSQGFGDSWVEGLDLFTLYLGYEGRMEYNRSYGSLAVNDGAKAIGHSTNNDIVKDLYAWFKDFGSSAINTTTIYPDIAGDYRAFMTNFYGGIKLNLMEDLMVSNKGATFEVKGQWAPSFIKDGTDFYSLTFNAVAGATILEVKNGRNGTNNFSVVAIDRVNVNWTDGNAVPVYASMPNSLGRKVRGFNTNSYNTNFTVVNNFDLRFAGPEPLIDGIFPRLNLYFDVGYHMGDYFNTGKNGVAAVSDSNLLCSTGFQLEMCFFDFIDLGFQFSYLIKGTNLRQPDNRFITGATFFLDF